ncbi:MAG TPA: ATP-binding cassette domain-containing protein, partial [Planctomycetota bacterium]|nr:ATP-binding cassette domain-containing protein [Planctomycetota bacterium]
MTLLRASGLSKAYGATLALADVSIDVESGEAVGVVGENGAGKSTLVSILGGAIVPDAGTIEWEGRRVRLRSPRDAAATGIGVVHQHDTLVPRFTVAENLGLAAGLERFPRHAALARRAHDLALQFGLDAGDPDAPCETLSVGARQRVEILKALARPTRLLLLDEPTAVLAPGEVRELLAAIEKLRAAGVAIVLIDHKLHEVLEVCSRVVVLRRGRVVARVATKETTAASLAAAMVGRPIEPDSRPAPPREGAPALAVRDLSRGRLHGITL